MKTIQDTYKLYNGVEIPCVGFGTWKTPNGPVCVDAVTEALRIGYRHIDTAAFYGNEESIGAAITASEVKREDIFVTSKVWNTERGYDKTMAAFETTMRKLGLDYLDLYLIHWPAVAKHYENWQEVNLSTWSALRELYKAGRIRAIGVSNFLPHHLEALLQTDVKPMVNQIEFHPGKMQRETVDLCKKHNILVEAWSPLGRGAVLENETVQRIAKAHGKTPAQICLAWCLQHGTLPLPKSVTPSRILENTDVFDIILTEKEMDEINALPYCGGSNHNPDEIDF